MLANDFKKYEMMRIICAKSADVAAGQEFSGCVFAHENSGTAPLKGKKVVCVGKIGDGERVFRTIDGKAYFSVTCGWGEKDGVLCGLSRGFCLPLAAPVTKPEDLQTLLDEPARPASFASALKEQARRSAIKKIIYAMKDAKMQ